MTHENTLDITQTAVVIVDMQEAFRSVISDFPETTARIALFAHAAQQLEIPIIVLEQNPKGLGHTANEIRAVLPSALEPIEKTTFSAGGSMEFEARLIDVRALHVVVCGIEAHICVNQTVHDLLAGGYKVHFLTDCITARSPSNRDVGFSKMLQSGAIPSSTEMALFELIGDSRHERFKTIQNLVK
jgi:nicotinamidase-related amidase